jgi:NTE family protein
MASPSTLGSSPVGAADEHLPDRQRRGIGLCLSGGGYRATLFHLGALRRLNELGILARPDFRTISSVSGGSITAAHVAAAVPWPLAAPLAEWDSRVAKPLRDFTKRDIRTVSFFKGLLPWKSTVNEIEKQYEKHLTSIRLAALPDRPEFVLCATDLAFGANWEFTKRRVGDYLLGYIPAPADWSLAKAVAASSCFPPIFQPMKIPKEVGSFIDGRVRREDPARWAAALDDLRLTDGGDYDNMGLEPVWKDHEYVLVSNAGGIFDFESDKNLLWRIQRYQAVQETQTRYLRQRWLIASDATGTLNASYWSVASARSRYDPADGQGYSRALAKQVIAEIRTDLDAFSDAEAAVLENHGYYLADVAISKHAAPLMPASPPALAPPHPDWAPPRKTEAEIRDALKDSSKRRLWGR